jgi:hypothetical protein
MMIRHGGMLFIQCRFHVRCIFYHTFIVYFTTLSLSQNAWVGSPLGSGMPKHLNLNRICSIAIRHTLSAMNSNENVLVSTVFCRLLYHMTRAQLRNTTYPVCDLLVTLLASHMRSINKSSHGDTSSSWHGHPMRQKFLCISIDFGKILLVCLEITIINT